MRGFNSEENSHSAHNPSPSRTALSPAGGGPSLSVDVINLQRQHSSSTNDGFTPGSRGPLTRRLSHLSTGRRGGASTVVPLTEKWVLVPGLFVAVISDEEEEEEEVAAAGTRPADPAGSSGGSSSGAHEEPRTAAEILSTAGKECWWWSPEVPPPPPHLCPPSVIPHPAPSVVPP